MARRGFTTVVERKLAVNLRSLTESTWRYIFGPLAIARRPDALAGSGLGPAPSPTPSRRLRRALPGLVALAVLGYGANDSGIAVPGAMLAVAVPGFVYLACRVEPTPPGGGARDASRCHRLRACCSPVAWWPPLLLERAVGAGPRRAGAAAHATTAATSWPPPAGS